MNKENESIYPLTWSLVAPKGRRAEIIIVDKNGNEYDDESEYNHPDHLVYRRHWNDICDTIIESVEDAKDFGWESFDFEGTIEYSDEYEDEDNISDPLSKAITSFLKHKDD